MQYFPLFVDTQSLRVLLIGAGEVASRKLDLLSRTDAHITVIAPDVCHEVLAYQQSQRIRLLQREADVEDIIDIDLLYLATADDELNQRFALYAHQHGIWVNVVDSPALCRFITPSIIDRGKLQVAISTAGAAPVFARDLRSRIETLLPHSLNPLLDFIAERRVEVQQKLPVFHQRKLFWEHFFEANGDGFDDKTSVHYANAFNQLSSQGEILLIDELTEFSLLPIAAMPLLQKLDVVYSELALPHSLLELCRRDASREAMISMSQLSELYDKGQRSLIYANKEAISKLVAYFPMAKHLKVGSI
ncbi:bifunctional precorrin-2 dehydrogenase/sirohydrochlorin ferrochelatase [Shewanella sp. Isolate11]|uniref:precorrin-2 dehydrogenase/sirohydrochlorin ferrochelatase family protein n=1 Tax=Shewanella sp. Isolate11 TaxID=2908530 RepID=UPI001EFE0237|nr:bifunctional precorrin-2 dehydrogenase/sirohydrochlorin ferrochelatase [Shewanella sp. Isolate11]MCG9696372.1 bifunctional precorrin-2 dehydrogenase/sirohydrochlorin ferrochelatase [Shewanella sp. Isolate11]